MSCWNIISTSLCENIHLSSVRQITNRSMGDARDEKELLEREQYRLKTFGNEKFVECFDNVQLAKSGFFLSQKEGIAKCHVCGLELKACDIRPDYGALVTFHKKKSPICSFAKKIYISKVKQSKAFVSAKEKLCFEKARLDTFVDWPVSFLSPSKLAEDGFYFMRSKDHCACIFCKGIIGAWEKTDTPRGEHQKHFSQCPFINGKPVGNVPLAQCDILSKFNYFSSNKICNPSDISIETSEDVTGHGNQSQNANVANGLTHKVKGINLSDIGLHEYRGPKFKQYITLDSRLNTFKFWPSEVKQQPLALAEAGFYYSGPIDHVRCFHCGNGICNWESDDVPWEIHAICYPNCCFVLLTKGQEYISKLLGEESHESCKSPKNVVSESDLDSLMELDVMLSVKQMGIPENRLRAVLRRRVEATGLPFFSIDQCMDNVFIYMEEETRLFLQDIPPESEDGEEAFSSLNSSNSNSSASTSMSSASPPSPADDVTVNLPELPRPSHTSEDLPPLPQLQMHVPTRIRPLPRQEMPNGLQAHLPPLGSVSNSSGRHPVGYENTSQGISRQTTNMPHLPIQMDYSEEKRKTQQFSEPLSKESSEKCASKLEGDKLKEELDKARETLLCKVCLDAEMTIVFLPCSHMATCATCAVSLSECPVCRGEIKFTIKPILS